MSRGDFTIALPFQDRVQQDRSVVVQGNKLTSSGHAVAGPRSASYSDMRSLSLRQDWSEAQQGEVLPARKESQQDCCAQAEFDIWQTCHTRAQPFCYVPWCRAFIHTPSR